MKTDGIQVIVVSGQALTTPECFKRCLLEMQGAEHAMRLINSCSFRDTGSLPKEADIKFLLSSFSPFLCETCFWFCFVGLFVFFFFPSCLLTY